MNFFELIEQFLLNWWDELLQFFKSCLSVVFEITAEIGQLGVAAILESLEETGVSKPSLESITGVLSNVNYFIPLNEIFGMCSVLAGVWAMVVSLKFALKLAPFVD